MQKTILEKTSPEFKKRFLIEFAIQLINASKTPELILLENQRKTELEKQKISIPEKTRIPQNIHLIPNQQNQNIKSNWKRSLELNEPHAKYKPLPRMRNNLQQLNISEPRLPPHLAYLQPYSTQQELDLGKLNTLFNDPMIRSIECNGTESPVIVQTMNYKPTNIFLNKDEIEEVIETFSNAAKIPIEEGVMRIVAGKYILLAIVSKVIGSKFIIKKIIPRQNFQQNLMPRRLY